jgi:serine/threonine protein kinase
MADLGGKYELGERIGGGGMADVYRALTRGAEGFARPVAVKRIKRNISTDKDFAKLFVDEARLAAKLTHPNVVQTIDFDRDETGCFYLVMELIEGVDLRALVKSGRIPVTAVVFIIAEVLRALDYAHEMVADGHPLTIVHRDISPHNIMLGWQGSVKVVDFGIAKAIEGSLISRSGSLKGKVAYMSPEQVHGQALDGRSDLFAAGIMLHELLTGERLFVASTEAATLSQVLTKPIANPRTLNDQVPADLDAVVMKLLERDREHRFERARDALEALLACSLATTQGRFDLETVLAERFPGKAPKRVRRLSRTPAEAEASARMKQAAGDLSTSATAETVAATPQARVPAPVLPKRTMTAMPATYSQTGSEVAKAPGSRLPQLALLVLVAAAAAAALLLFTGEEKEPKPRVELVTAFGEDAGVLSFDAALATLDAGQLPASVVDAAAEQAIDKNDDDKSEERRTEARAKMAKLTIRVKPWASIEVDGKNYGQTPQTIELSRGRHRIVLRNPGIDRSESFSLSLKAGQSKNIDKDWLGD